MPRLRPLAALLGVCLIAAAPLAQAQTLEGLQRQAQSAAERAAREAAEKAAREALERAANRVLDRDPPAAGAATPAAAGAGGVPVLAKAGEALGAPTPAAGAPCAWTGTAGPAGGPAERVGAFLKGAPVFTPGNGFCPSLATAAVPAGLEAGHAARAAFTLTTTTAGAAAGSTLNVRINSPPDLAAASAIKGSDAKGAFFALPARTGTFQGFAVHGDLLVITRNASPVWRPVEQYRLMTWFIARQDAALGSAPAADRAAIEARRDAVRSKRAWLSEGSSGDGCLIADPADPAQIMDVGAATDAACTWRMVEPNPDYIDKTAPAGTVQLLTIAGFDATRPAPTAPTDVGRWAGGHAVWGLDWQAFRKEVMGGG